MKVKLLFITVLAVLSFDALAQQDFENLDGLQIEPKVASSVGIIGGLDLSTFLIGGSYLDASEIGMTVGFNAGIAANFRFCNRNERSSAKTGLLAIQPEVRYAMMGSGLGDNSLSTHYIMVPIMLQIYPTRNFYFEIGPEMALNIGHSPNNVAAGNIQFDFTNLKANDIMAGVGLGYSSNGFSVGVRYNHGFSDIAENLRWKNSMIQINIGYFFSLNKSRQSVIMDF